MAHLGDVVEPLGAEEVGNAVDGVEVEAELGEAKLLVVAEIAEGVRGGGGEGCVVGLGPVDDFLEFDVAAWFEMSSRK